MFKSIWLNRSLGILATIGASLLLVDRSAAAFAAQPPTLEIGQSAPDFELPGVDGKTYRLADFKDAKVLAIIFTCNHCPTAQAYEDRIIQLHRDFNDRSVALVAISPNDPLAVTLDELGWTDLGDSLDDMKIRAQDKHFPFPYLYDGETQKVAKAYGVLATPHVFIFDADRKLRYNGRIDDQEVKEVKSHDTRNAIEALLAGQPVPVETTRVFGCSTKWAEKRANAEKLLDRWDKEPAEVELIDVDDVKKLAANDTDKLQVVNVWATWCGPCVQEMPDLVTMHRMYRKRPFQFVTISLDDSSAKDQAQLALAEVHASGKNFLFSGDDKDKLAEALDREWHGPVPYTLLIAPGGKVIYRHEGPIEPLEVKRAIVDFIGRTYASKK